MESLMLDKINKEVAKGSMVALSIITKACGSSPRGEGTMMAVVGNGEVLGTIGGGALEKNLIDLCKECIKENSNRRFSFSLTESEKGLKMACGGEVEGYIKIFSPVKKLLIVGGGHVALPLHSIAHILGYHVVIFEDREDYCNKERFKDADELILGDINENLSNYPIDEKSNVVIITRGHIYDEIALRAVINSNANYIGMIGSKTKVGKLKTNLKEDGYSLDIPNLYTPIGLDLGGETPEEIALSILSEISLVSNKGNLAHLGK